jgi:hypothetical protein
MDCRLTATTAEAIVTATAGRRGRGLPWLEIQAVKVLVSLDQASAELLGSLFVEYLTRSLGGLGLRGSDHGESGDGGFFRRII